MTRKSQRYADIALIAVTIAVIIGMVVALRPQATATAPVDPVVLQNNRLEAAAQKLPSALFIGDSYTAGSGTRELSPSCMAAVRMGWLCDLSALPGTGYITGGPSSRFTTDEHLGPSTAYFERIPSLAAKFQPDVVVLDGGRGDYVVPKNDVFKAISATIADARSAWPDATIVFERPRFLSRPNDDLGFDGAFITRLTREAGATKPLAVIDPIKSFAGTDVSRLISGDGIHPNRWGDLGLASAITASLLASGLTRDR